MTWQHSYQEKEIPAEALTLRILRIVEMMISTRHLALNKHAVLGSDSEDAKSRVLRVPGGSPH